MWEQAAAETVHRLCICVIQVSLTTLWKRRSFKVKQVDTELVSNLIPFSDTQVHLLLAGWLHIYLFLPYMSVPGEPVFFGRGGAGCRRKFKFGRLSCLLPPGSPVSDLTGLFLAFSIQGHRLSAFMCACARVRVRKRLRDGQRTEAVLGSNLVHLVMRLFQVVLLYIFILYFLWHYVNLTDWTLYCQHI